MSITFQKRQKELNSVRRLKGVSRQRLSNALKKTRKNLGSTASSDTETSYSHIIDAAAFSSPLRRFSIARSPNKTEQRNPCDKTLCRKSLLWHDG